MLAGVNLLKARGAGAFVHCGDIGTARMLDALAGERAWFVFGNTDVDRAGLRRYAEELGITCLGDFGVVELSGKRIGVMHGDDFSLRRRLLLEQALDYLLSGHTHVADDTRSGAMRLINPGALHRARVKTVATLDLERDELTLHPLREVDRFYP